jgi:hypothetical protein
MKLGDLMTLWAVVDALGDELEDLEVGESVTSPKIRGVKLGGRRYTLVISANREK